MSWTDVEGVINAAIDNHNLLTAILSPTLLNLLQGEQKKMVDDKIVRSSHVQLPLTVWYSNYITPKLKMHAL